MAGRRPEEHRPVKALNLCLLCNFEGVVYLNAEIADGALEFGVSEQQLKQLSDSWCDDKSGPPLSVEAYAFRNSYWVSSPGVPNFQSQRSITPSS